MLGCVLLVIFLNVPHGSGFRQHILFCIFTQHLHRPKCFSRILCILQCVVIWPFLLCTFRWFPTFIIINNVVWQITQLAHTVSPLSRGGAYVSIPHICIGCATYFGQHCLCPQAYLAETWHERHTGTGSLAALRTPQLPLYEEVQACLLPFQPCQQVANHHAYEEVSLHHPAPPNSPSSPRRPAGIGQVAQMRRTAQLTHRTVN